MLCLWLYCISITKKSDVYHSDLSCYVSHCTVLVSIGRLIRLSQWFIMLCLITVSISLRRGICISQWIITLCLTTVSVSLGIKSDRSITVIYHALSLTVLYQYHRYEWYVCHSDLSCYVSDCTVSVSPRWVIRLSQWFIMLYLWLYYKTTSHSSHFIRILNQQAYM